jgi:alanyl-tRNA synthetase
MQSSEIRKRFLKFFEARGHKVIPSSSLIPKDDPSVLFTTAGMQQFKKYYTNPELAEKELGNKNVTTIQKCVRTSDIDEVGDNSHLTFFEMMGNFSFGGYGRKEAIEYAYEFISKEMGLKISHITFFKGNKNVPRDEESEKIWLDLGLKKENIRESDEVFWGPTGDSGPCGPTTEIYCSPVRSSEEAKEGKNVSGEDVELWNIVFNEYFCDGSREKLDKGEAKLKELPSLGVDTGMGFERLVSIVQKKESVYDTDLFFREKTREERIVSDHIKAALFLTSDGIMPSNTGQGYVLRRLIRRAVRFSKEPLEKTILKIKEIYKGIYPLEDNGEILKEEKRFRETLEKGMKEFKKGTDPFILFTSYGFPIELTEELAEEEGKKIDLEDFNKKMAEHQKLSQTASTGMFKGGLAGGGKMETKYHTATHLLLAALRTILKADIVQKGSNITAERLRFDFNWPEKLTFLQLKEIESLVNQKIQEAIPVEMREMPKEEAVKIIKNLSFDLSKYGDIVKVYKIGDFSIELCGGPHVKNTSELGYFRILKEEASSQGVRRIKAILG